MTRGAANRPRNVLITGMSGTGKSTVIRELAARGYQAIDTSWSPEWEEAPADGSGPGWIWREDRIEALLRALRSHRAS